MITHLKGQLCSKNPPTVCVDVGGVGYAIDVPMSTYYELPAVGSTVCLLTHLMIREDAHQLYGFLQESERQLFRQLIKVTSIGARTALAILSGMSTPDLSVAIYEGDVGLLSKIPGIGKKTAERLILELRGKIPEMDIPLQHSAQSDIVHALMALGYNEKEARKMAQSLPVGISVEDGIKAALQSMVGGK